MSTTSDNDLGAWEDFIRSQCKIANRWLKRGNETEDKDVYAKFFFYFAGFNAIYFMWGIINKLRQGQIKLGKNGKKYITLNPPEKEHIKNLLNGFDEANAKEILDKVENEVNYFCKPHPIQQMRKRCDKNLLEGDPSDSIDCQKILNDKNRSASERIAALGQILYFVRSNLVHGSKELSDSGDDFEIINSSIKPLKIFLTEAVEWTRGKCPFFRAA